MPAFSPRRLLRKQIAIFNATGQLINLWIPGSVPNASSYTPGNLFTADEDLPESNYTTQYIRGKFEETDNEQMDGPGKRRYVTGIITVPMLYKAILASAEFIDPYLDGSRFVKDGTASPDEERIFITQGIKSISLQSPGDIV